MLIDIILAQYISEAVSIVLAVSAILINISPGDLPSVSRII